MERSKVLEILAKEREYQEAKFGSEFDTKNTINDWISYLIKYLGNAVTAAGTFAGDPKQNAKEFGTAIAKVGTLCVAILERDAHFAPRHYDK